MQVCLVHHAEAVGPAVDPQRPLSARGIEQAEWLAAAAGAAGVAPEAIWHSGKLRARQTAEPFLRLNPFAGFTMVRGLRPDDPPGLMADALAAEAGNVLLVGHMPHLAALHQRLTGRRDFPLHGCVVLERDAAGAWSEVFRARPA